MAMRSQVYEWMSLGPNSTATGETRRSTAGVPKDVTQDKDYDIFIDSIEGLPDDEK
mgnify:CR=1 FL=1